VYKVRAAGDTDPEALLAVDVPLALVAVTVNVYAVPVVKPLTVIGDDAPVPVIDPGVDVAVNPVIAEPPVSLAVNATVAEVALASATAPIVGACGTVVAVIDPDVPEIDVLIELVPLTVNV
jgi:hypothetical protein